MTSPSTKVVVLSDTHGYFSESLATTIEQLAPNLIIHAGDSESAQILWQLEQIAPLIAVRGNCDWHSELEQLPFAAKHQVDNLLIAVAHRPEDLMKVLRELNRKELANHQVIGIHGHTHVPKLEQDSISKATILCPGSPTEPRKDSQPNIALLTLAPDVAEKPIQVEFIEV